MEEFRGAEGWNWNLISFELPDTIKDRVKAIPIQVFGQSEDSLMWRFTRDGDFSTKSAYLQYIEDNNAETSFQGQWIWKLDILPKIIMFLWLCFHTSVPVKSVLATRGINCDNKCPSCKRQDETIIHLLRDCELARKYWSCVEVPPAHVHTFSGSLEEWLQANSVSLVKHKSDMPWSTVFLFTIWAIWKNRNKIVFENSIPNPRLAIECINQARDYHFCVSKAKTTTTKAAIPVAWTKPREDWFKLNSDGASLGNPGKAGGGGIIRNSQGGWVRGYARSIGLTSSIIAELWALRDGMQLADHMGIRQLEVELDAKVIVGLLNSNKNPNSTYAPLLSNCRYLLAKLPQVRVSHVFREANKCADWLAKWGTVMKEDFVVFEFPSTTELETLVAKDINGLYYARLVAASMAAVSV